MNVTRRQATSLRTAIEHWSRIGHLDQPTATALRADIEVIPFDWRALAKYAFWCALICIVIAISALVADEALRQLLQVLFEAPHSVKFLGLSGLSAIIYWAGATRQSRHPNKIFSNEAILFLGVLTTAGAIYQFGHVIDTGSGHFSVLLLLSSLVYGLLGVVVRSKLIWLFALISLGAWMGAETGYMSGWGAYYLGMNYPLRFVLFGGALVAAGLMLERTNWFEHLSRTTLATGLGYLFIALWIMSIFGNYGDEATWRESRPIELFHWSILFALASAAAIYHGLRFDDAMTKGFGLIFLLINLYTRFFEFFWDTTHKALFFGLLGISLWYLGSRAEAIWHGRSKGAAEEG
ncbi:MAG: DUF2157 domain-containing protein [Geminicoccaceae bacterium]